jgi:aspartate racemase
MKFPAPLVGILGGMGPQAGLDMAAKLVAMTRTQRDQDHIPFLLFSLPGAVPDRTAFLLGETSENPAHAIAAQLETMAEMGVTIAVIACNTAHAAPIFDVVLDILREKDVKLPLVNLVRETVAYIGRRHPGIRKVGILGTQGTYQAHLYDSALADAGLQAVLPHADVRERIVHAIIYGAGFGIKTTPGPVSEEARRRAVAALKHLQQLGAEAIVLGCTELPLAVSVEDIDGIPILDPAKIAVENLISQTCPDRLL